MITEGSKIIGTFVFRRNPMHIRWIYNGDVRSDPFQVGSTVRELKHLARTLYGGSCVMWSIRRDRLVLSVGTRLEEGVDYEAKKFTDGLHEDLIG